MPIKRTTVNGKPAFKWGESGKAYPYDPNNATSRKKAKEKALSQGKSININKK